MEVKLDRPRSVGRLGELPKPVKSVKFYGQGSYSYYHVRLERDGTVTFYRRCGSGRYAYSYSLVDRAQVEARLNLTGRAELRRALSELERARDGKKSLTSLDALASVNVPLVVGGD